MIYKGKLKNFYRIYHTFVLFFIPWNFPIKVLEFCFFFLHSCSFVFSIGFSLIYFKNKEGNKNKKSCPWNSNKLSVEVKWFIQASFNTNVWEINYLKSFLAVNSIDIRERTSDRVFWLIQYQHLFWSIRKSIPHKSWITTRIHLPLNWFPNHHNNNNSNN